MKFKSSLYLLAVLSATVILSCNKNADDNAPVATSITARLAFINFLPNAAPVNLYVNGARQSFNRIGYTESSGYLTITAGQQNIAFRDTTLSRVEYYAGVINLKPDTLYSLFLTGKQGNIVTIQTTDTAKTDIINRKPKVRILNGAPDAPAYKLYLNNNLYTKFSSQNYGSISKFDRVDTGKIPIKILNAATNNVILSDSVKLQPLGVYTLFINSIYTNNNATGLKITTIANR